MTDKIKKIISEIFDVAESDIHEDTGPDTLDSWDSMGHLNLILSFEEEFKITISPEEAAEMLSVGMVRSALRAKGVNLDG